MERITERHWPLTRRILRTPQAAAYVGLSVSSLEKKRVSGDGPQFLHLGGRAVGYDIKDLDAWLDGQKEVTVKNEQA